MAGTSLVAALVVNFTIGVIKTIVGLITGSGAMISEAYHSFADTFNQILLALGIKRSAREPDLTHPFGYSKVQFFWSFVVAILIFGISGTLAFYEGIKILTSEEGHDLRQDLIFWNLLVLGVAIILEAYAWKTAYNEAKRFQEEMEIDNLMEALDEKQDPVLISLLVEDSLAMVGLVIAFVGTVLTSVLHNEMIDGITSLFIGIVLMTGGLLLAKYNKTYLVGRSVSNVIQKQIKDIVNGFEGIKRIKEMKTMLLGPNDMIVALDLVFTDEARNTGVKGIADDIDRLEKLLSDAIEPLTPNKIFIESQLAEVAEVHKSK